MARLLRYLNDADGANGEGGAGNGGSGNGNGGSSCDRPEGIVNRDMLNAKHEEEEKKQEESREERKARWAAKVAGPAPAPVSASASTPAAATNGASTTPTRILKPESYFELDYLLVGPAVWDLLSTKFGYDVSIPCRLEVSKGVWGRPSTLCVVVPIALDDGDDDLDGLYSDTDAAIKENSKVVEGVKHARIDVPESGKWRYGNMDDRVSKKAREEEEQAAEVANGGGDAKMVRAVQCSWIIHFLYPFYCAT